ncbi:unnamed protein product [Porites lobata]|uniref:RNA/RNP complex-1-interacting phosphatase n=1 Tax=Porites lobata TaxID=104759 RepID=A0ABN8RTQ3_9CNID|nr:unnamed protein product [Porites lobata]
MFRFSFSLPGRVLFIAGLRLDLSRFSSNMTSEEFIDKRIPDKWRDYDSCGVPISGERIIAFKTPLSSKYDNESDIDNGIKPFERFTPMDLLNHLKRKKLKLGMVIDFTNTFRYYNGKEFYDHGIEYRKIKCIGKEIPNEDVVRRFKTEVCSFMANNTKGDLVGVHCTHGLNRAGYIVCRYLIECRGYTPEKAIKAFNDARGYQMERENYLDDLKTKTPKSEDFSRIANRDTRKRRDSLSGSRPRYIHTDTESRQVSHGKNTGRIDGVTPYYLQRRGNEYEDFESNYRHRDRNRFTEYHSQTRNYTTRMYSRRERRDVNYHDYGNTYDNSYHNYNDRYNNHANYGYREYGPTRSRERSYRSDHVKRGRSYKDRSEPYSHQRSRYY